MDDMEPTGALGSGAIFPTPLRPFSISSPRVHRSGVTRYPSGTGSAQIREGAATSETDTPEELILVRNWFEELKQRVPTN